MASFPLPPQIVNIAETMVRTPDVGSVKPTMLNASRTPLMSKMRTCLILGLAGSFSTLLGAWSLWHYRQKLITKVLSWGEHFGDHQALRDSFTGYPFPTTSAKGGHTHANSAAERSASSALIKGFITASGMTPYFVQESKRERGQGCLGSLVYRWNKDTHRQPHEDHEPDDSVRCFVDVDYYVSMPNHLLSFRPLILYSFTPSRAGKVSKDKEYWYFFDEKSNVHLNVQGGAIYPHPLWDYGSDELRSFTWFGGPKIAGIRLFTPLMTSYLVDRRRVGDDRSIVLLTPVRKWTWLGAILSRFSISGTFLSRLETYYSGFTQLLIHDKEGLHLSVARVNQTYSGTTPLVKTQQLRAVDRVTKCDLTIHSTRSWDVDKDESPAICDFIRSQVDWLPKVTYLPTTTVRNFQFIQEEYDPDAKQSLTGFMRPLVDGAITPDQCASSDKVAVEERITKLQKEVKNVAPTKFLLDTMEEFSKFFPRGGLMPAPYDLVREKQARPSQQRLLDQADQTGDNVKPENKSFVKREAYAAVKPPRMISTVIPTDKMEWSRYMYSLANHLKTLDWYGFGQSGKKLAQRVVTLCEDAQNIALSDFGKMDGRIAMVVRLLEEMLMLRLFPKVYHPEIKRLLKSQYNMPGRTRFGIKFLTEFSRLSGSPETSNFNTILAAFVAFLGFRLMRLEPQEAWDRLGVYGGDDGFTADIDPAKYIRAAKMMGALLKVDVVQRGEPGVNFLSRFYSPDVWFGDPNSCCDIRRQLSKFHTSIPLPKGVPATVKLLEKSRSFFCTDRNTPIIGPFVSKVVDLSGGVDSFDPLEDPYRLRSWSSRVHIDDQYPNEYGDWMHDFLREQIPDINVDLFRATLDKATKLDHFLNFPLLSEPREVVNDTDQTVLVGEEIIKGKGKEKEIVCEEPKKKKSSRKRPNNKRRKRQNARVKPTTSSEVGEPSVPRP